ncbi:MAG: cyclic nucleotide-binding domain-containing protein [Nitrospirota bacterium]
MDIQGRPSKELIRELKGEPLFSFFTDEEIEKIEPFLEFVEYPAHTVLFEEGEPGDFAGFIFSGKVEVKKRTEFKGNQIIVALLSRGSIVGELSLFNKRNRTATAEAVEDTSLIVLRNDRLEDFLDQYPRIGIKMLKGIISVLSLRLSKATERLADVF